MIEQWFGTLTRRPCKWSYDADHARYLARHHRREPVPALAEAA